MRLPFNLKTSRWTCLHGSDEMKLHDVVEHMRQRLVEFVSEKNEGQIRFTVVTTKQGGITRLETDAQDVRRDVKK